MSFKLGGCALKELRIHLCQTSKQSEGVREFVQKNYVSLKKANPDFPILIRECANTEPRVWARYERGAEMWVGLGDMRADQVLGVIQGLVK